MSKEEFKLCEEEFNKIFAKNLRYYLTQNNMTQLELSQKLGVGTTSVYNWCNAIKTPRMDKVDKMCSIFGIRRSDLMENKPKSEMLKWTDNLTKDNADIIPDLLSDSILIEHIKKLVSLNSEHKQTIYDNITYWYEKEGH